MRWQGTCLVRSCRSQLCHKAFGTSPIWLHREASNWRGCHQLKALQLLNSTYQMRHLLPRCCYYPIHFKQQVALAHLIPWPLLLHLLVFALLCSLPTQMIRHCYWWRSREIIGDGRALLLRYKDSHLTLAMAHRTSRFSHYFGVFGAYKTIFVQVQISTYFNSVSWPLLHFLVPVFLTTKRATHAIDWLGCCDWRED